MTNTFRPRPGALTAAVLAAIAFAFPATAAAKGPSGTSVATAAADLKWNDVPDFPGLRMAVAAGDPSKAASHFFIKFPPGFSAPIHHHNANHSVVVMAGNLVLNIDGKDVMLRPGSFFSFSGKKKHGTRCEPGVECMLFVDARGKWDVIPEAAPKPEAKKADAKK
ncbi:MAG: cupin domain-containing protein [Betaproteobacteria bacterium]|nr:cupin domain-containing protein [Betaproteobacteria bacterium]